MQDPNQFRQQAIIPALQHIGLYSEAAVELLLGTALQESDLKYTQQLNGGPALGYFQMEPRTHDDLHARVLASRGPLRTKVLELAGGRPSAQLMKTNHLYAAAMCRVHYMQFSDPFPQAGNLQAQANYWKLHYNTYEGRGTAQQYIEKWRRYLG